MHGYLRQSTATAIKAGPFLSATDGVTPQAGLSAPAAAGPAATSGVALDTNGTLAGYTLSGWAHDRLGYYTVNLSTGDTGTVGRLKLVFIDAANYAPVEMTWSVLSQAVYDALFGASALSTYAGADTAGTTTLLARIGGSLTIAGGKVAATLAAADVTGDLPADLQTIKAQAVTAAAGVTFLASIGTATVSAAQTGDSYARLGAPTGASIAADIQTRSTFAGGAVSSVTGSVGSVTAPVTAGTVSDKTGYALASAGLDSITIETGVNARQALSPILAACAGVLAGAGTGTITIKGGNVPATTRITATTDSSGNRSSVTLALPT